MADPAPPQDEETETDLSDAGDDADGAELLHEVGLRDGVGKPGHVDAVVVALVPALLAAAHVFQRFFGGQGMDSDITRQEASMSQGGRKVQYCDD